MDPTTLLTFLFQAPPDVRQVELLGSWDNFTQPYRMHHDRRRGTGFWSGCFKFENIVFDGISVQWTRPRSGGLKQGGTYWYYYRLDYDLEAYDDLLPTTTSCPLMPGQVLNVIEVPIEIVEPVSRCRSASADIAGTLANLPMTHTLDPGAKFAALAPPPVSKVHERSISDFALGARLEHSPASAGRGVAFNVPGWPEVREDAASLDSRPSKRLRSSSDRSEYSRYSRLSSAGSHARLSIIESYAERPESMKQWAMPAFSKAPPAPTVQSPDLDDDQQFEIDLADRYVDWDGTVSSHNNPDSIGDALTSCDPFSMQDVQFCSSETAQDNTGSPRWHPRTFSIANHPSQLQGHEHDHPELGLRPGHLSPTLGQGALDICSPTFSAATMSSEAGLGTPFRLSVGGSHDPTAYTLENATFDEVAIRLQSLDVAGQSPSPSSSPLERREDYHRSLSTEYVLPDPLAGESVQSLGKFSLPSTGLVLPDFLQETTSGSMAEDIFSELGYLSSSIG